MAHPPTTLRRSLRAAPRRLAALSLLACPLAIALPSRALAARSDLLLAALVAATGLGIGASDLLALRRHAAAVLALSILPLLAVGAAAWLISRPFGGQVREGLLAVGLSSSEVASIGLVALAGGEATIALGAVAGSLVLAALLGPVALAALAAGASVHSHPHGGRLLARFALVVIAPLGAGVALRSVPAVCGRLAALDSDREGVAALVVAALVYAALSGTRGGHGLPAAILASVLLLGVSAGLAELWRRLAPGPAALPGALAVAMRDFAVAAALAQQAFGSGAGAVPGVYGVLMLVAGAMASRPGRLSRWRRGTSA